MRYIIIILCLLLIITGCSKDNSSNNLCEYEPSIGGCEVIYFDGDKCIIINEGACEPNDHKYPFITLEECRQHCE